MNEQMRLVSLTVADGLDVLRRWGAFADVDPIGCDLDSLLRSVGAALEGRS